MNNARQERLVLEYRRLVRLTEHSAFIQIDPIEVQTDYPPEKYVVTFTCIGIERIDEKKSPKFSEFHQVLISLPSDFPLHEPYLKWLTPIWHPNIQHEEPRHVCTNSIQSWWPGKFLSELVICLGEMIQYKNYHADWCFPYPLDREAAEWVTKYAEPNGIISSNKPIDERLLVRIVLGKHR
jgi:ubiquitin-protein ligase